MRVARPHALPGDSTALRQARRPQGAGEVEEVRPLGLIELQGAGERLEHAVGDALHVTALDPGVVGDADAGQDGDLLATQLGDPAAAIGGQARLLGSDSPGGRSRTLGSRFARPPIPQRRAARGRLGDPVGTPLNRDSHSLLSRCFHRQGAR
jgi:hypothetical protein